MGDLRASHPSRVEGAFALAPSKLGPAAKRVFLND